MKMRAVPLVEGIVVAEKSKDLLLEVRIPPLWQTSSTENS